MLNRWVPISQCFSPAEMQLRAIPTASQRMPAVRALSMASSSHCQLAVPGRYSYAVPSGIVIEGEIMITRIRGAVAGWSNQYSLPYVPVLFIRSGRQAT